MLSAPNQIVCLMITHNVSCILAWVILVDLLGFQGTVTLDDFRGVVFVGGFSYADVLDSGKGWAATIKYNKKACL